MNNKFACFGLAALACAVSALPASSATMEELSLNWNTSYSAEELGSRRTPAASAASQKWFMDEEACAVLDRKFIVQPAKESAVNMMRPCLEAVSARYGVPLKLGPSEKGLDLFVGDDENAGTRLQEVLRTELALQRGQFFGHPVNVRRPRTCAAADRFFMNEEACKVLDRKFMVQPAKESAVNMMRPCLEAISARYGAPLRLAQSEKGLDLFVGDDKQPGEELLEMLKGELPRRDGRFFGYEVNVRRPRTCGTPAASGR